MTNTTLNVNFNNLTEEERNTLLALVKKSVKKPKVWKPKNRERYYFINHGANECIDYYDWDNDSLDDNLYSIGNCFRTQEEAEFALEKQKVHTELKRFALEHNETEIDWNDSDQKKYYLMYDYYENRIFTSYNKFTKTPIVYFTSKEIAEQAVEAIGKERLKKYYFEVK